MRLGIVVNSFLVLGNYKKCPKNRFTRPGSIQNTPLLGIVGNNFLVLSIKMVTILGVPLPPKKGTPTRGTPMRVTKTKSAPTTGLPDDV